MGLRKTAYRDAQRIQEDAAGGFGWPIVLISPDGSEYPVTGFSTDIHLQVDPETGQMVSGRTVSASVSLLTLSEAGVTEYPYGVTRKGERPWLVRMDDIAGNQHTLKVSESYPDQGLGNLVMMLEGYSGG